MCYCIIKKATAFERFTQCSLVSTDKKYMRIIILNNSFGICLSARHILMTYSQYSPQHEDMNAHTGIYIILKSILKRAQETHFSLHRLTVYILFGEITLR